MDLSIPIIHTRMSNPISSLREERSTNNCALRRGQIWYHGKSVTKFMDYFTKSKTFSRQWLFTYADNKIYLHKTRKSLLNTNINHSLSDRVVEETVYEPKCLF